MQSSDAGHTAPSHYMAEGIECKDVMIATQGEAAYQDFCVCNAIKYLFRWRSKGGSVDVRKARDYLDEWLKIEGC